jgi:exo-1,4-beta-D-glucosaminidase
MWEFHNGGGQFKQINTYREAMQKRYGPADNLEEFTLKAQAMNYEGVRSMFEAYSQNKYRSTGVIQWMMNNGWPSMIWNLYDWYLRPNGGYFGAKKANEPVHAQFAPNDRTLWVVNSTYVAVPGLTLNVQVLDLDSTEKLKQDHKVDAGPDSAVKVVELPQIDTQRPYFVALKLKDASNKVVSSNVYWVSAKPETLDWDKSTWYYTPAKEYADFTALDSLPKVKLQLSSNTVRKGDKVVTTTTIKNPDKNIAFFVRLKANKGADEVLPVLWQDNYFSLLPGEERVIEATHDASDVGSAPLRVTAQGWNAEGQ